MKIMRIAGWVAGGIVGVLLLVVIAVTFLVDPNDYKDDIERLVEQQTGRQLVLDGDLELAVFPWIALEFGPAALSDAPGFGDEPFLSLREARLSVRFWPLLRGRVEIGNVRLDGVALRLITDAEGRENWADLASSEPEPSAGETPAGESLEVPTIAGLELRDAAVLIEDRRDDSRIGVTEFNLETGRLASGEPFDLRSSLLLTMSPELSLRTTVAAEVTADFAANVHALSGIAIDVTALGSGFPAEGQDVRIRAQRASLDVAQEQHSLSGIEIEADWRGEGLPASGVPVVVRAADLKADLAGQALALDGLDIDAAGARITGSLTGEEILDAPKLSGPLELAPVSLREWLPRLGIEVPVTRDADVLESLAFTTQATLTPESADLGNLVMRLDDTTARGSFGVADFASEALRFDLEVDRIDADRYLAPEPSGENRVADAGPIEIPVDTLRQLNARGTLVIGEAVFSGIRFTQLKLGVTARDGDVGFNPVEASAYGGQFRGDIGIAAASDTPRLTVDQRVTDVDFAPLFKDLFESERVAGKGSFNARLTASGRDTAAIERTLGGTLDFSVRDGALEGADLWYEIRRARAVMRQQAIPVRSGPAQTPFTALSGSATVREGVIQSQDLTMAMEYLRIAGSAAIDLPRSEIDSRLTATVLRIPAEGADTTQMQELVDARIPVRITGPLADPSVRPDVEGYLKERVRERVEEEKEKIEEKIRDTLQDRLRRALGGN